MKLFELEPDSNINLLPKDGTVNYYGSLFDSKEAHLFYNKLLENIAWKNDEAIIFGKKIITKRKVAWYGDKPYSYTYSKTTKSALPWTTELQILKQRTEDKTGELFNSCLLNLYHDGSEGMSWHSDAEKDLKKNVYNLGKNNIKKLLMFIYCVDSKFSTKLLKKIIEEIDKMDIPDFPFSGQYLIDQGLKDGRKIGYALKELEREWVQKDFNLKTNEITFIVDKIKKSNILNI